MNNNLPIIVTMSNSLYARWPFLILYYEMVRAILGLSYAVIYGFIAVMFLLRVKIENMLLVFFGITIISYVFGQEVEANHYMSFVFGFMVLLLLTRAYALFHGDVQKKKYKNFR